MRPPGVDAQTQIRCTNCGRRLADIVNEVKGGHALVEIKCPKCGHPHTEVMRST